MVVIILFKNKCQLYDIHHKTQKNPDSQLYQSDFCVKTRRACSLASLDDKKMMTSGPTPTMKKALVSMLNGIMSDSIIKKLVCCKRDHLYCIIIDKEAGEYLPHLYGAAHYVLVEDIDKLPVKVSDI